MKPRRIGGRLGTLVGAMLFALTAAALTGCDAQDKEANAKGLTDMSVAEFEAAVARTASASGAAPAQHAERHLEKTGARIERGQITLIEALAPSKSAEKRARTEARGRAEAASAESPQPAASPNPPSASGVDPALAQWAQRPSQGTPSGFRVVVRLEDGEMREFVQPIVDGLTVGDYVQVVRTSLAPT